MQTDAKGNAVAVAHIGFSPMRRNVANETYKIRKSTLACHQQL
jgi:hypothetical protein